MNCPARVAHLELAQRPRQRAERPVDKHSVQSRDGERQEHPPRRRRRAVADGTDVLGDLERLRGDEERRLEADHARPPPPSRAAPRRNPWPGAAPARGRTELGEVEVPRGSLRHPQRDDERRAAAL
jgi:hypothetical protein